MSSDPQEMSSFFKHYCFGCSGGWPRSLFHDANGDFYYHQKGRPNTEGQSLTIGLVCFNTEQRYCENAEPLPDDPA